VSTLAGGLKQQSQWLICWSYLAMSWCSGKERSWGTLHSGRATQVALERQKRIAPFTVKMNGRCLSSCLSSMHQSNSINNYFILLDRSLKSSVSCCFEYPRVELKTIALATSIGIHSPFLGTSSTVKERHLARMFLLHHWLSKTVGSLICIQHLE
jgi:hypothetical protein